MTTHKYWITGQILHSQSDHGLAHLRVEIGDFGPLLFDEVASTATDDDGRFEVEFTQPHYAEFLPFHQPSPPAPEALPREPTDLARGLHDRRLPPRVDRTPQGPGPHPLERPPGETRIVLGLDQPDAFVVHGVVRRAEGTPLADVPIKAFDVVTLGKGQ